MQKTRGEILLYLSDHPNSGAGEIARFLDLTAANIRYHLDILTEQGAIQVSGERRAGAGRPVLLYTLSPYSLGDSTKRMTGALLSVVAKGEGGRDQADSVAINFLDGVATDARRDVQRFNQAIEVLDQFHYHASWKATREGPEVEFKHCPYQDLAKDHPLLCQVDEAILSELFQTPLRLKQRRDFDEHPYSPCIFTTQSET